MKWFNPDICLASQLDPGLDEKRRHLKFKVRGFLTLGIPPTHAFFSWHLSRVFESLVFFFLHQWAEAMCPNISRPSLFYILPQNKERKSWLLMYVQLGLPAKDSLQAFVASWNETTIKRKKKLQQANIFSSLFILGFLFFFFSSPPPLNCFPIQAKQVLKHETLPRDFLYKTACFYSLAFKLDMLLTQNVKIKTHLLGRSCATGMSQKKKCALWWREHKR